MVQSLDQATIVKLKPLSVGHENTKLYAMLKQCMTNNEELRQALLTAAETIEQLTEKLLESRATTDNTECP
jgi:hypothetical protein